SLIASRLGTQVDRLAHACLLYSFSPLSSPGWRHQFVNSPSPHLWRIPSKKHPKCPTR
ncbi:hypothetical protein COCHEDRAFT_118083, partial [Bipolaris maydis C5]